MYKTHLKMVSDENLSFAGQPVNRIIEGIKEVYLSDKRSWIIGFSGGKDSTVILSLVYQAIALIPESKRTKPVYVVCSDTLVETPVVVGLIKNVLDAVQTSAKEHNLPITTKMVVPKQSETFWVNLLGKGYPAPTRSFRWCTERMKIRPVSEFIEDKVSRFGEVIVVLGSRRAESASRAQSIEKHSIEGSVLSRHSSLPNAYTYMPIEDWEADEVWEYLLSAPAPWGMSNQELFSMYKGSNQGECPLVIDKHTPSCGNSRFGCWTCTVVSEDKALHGLIESGMEWMRPFLDFRDELYKTTLPENKKEYRNFRRRNGRIDLMRQKDDAGQQITALNEDGSINQDYDPNYIPGPYLMKFRQKWLRELLKIQKKVDQQGHDYLAITDDELVQIRREWLMDPIEPDWSDSLPKIIAEFYPEKMHLFPSRDIGAFGETELTVVKQVAEQAQVSPILLKKIIDAEVEVSGLGSRRGIRKKLEAILRQDWSDVESSVEKSVEYKRDVELYKDMRTAFEKKLQELTR